MYGTRGNVRVSQATEAFGPLGLGLGEMKTSFHCWLICVVDRSETPGLIGTGEVWTHLLLSFFPLLHLVSGQTGMMTLD